MQILKGICLYEFYKRETNCQPIFFFSFLMFCSPTLPESSKNHDSLSRNDTLPYRDRLTSEYTENPRQQDLDRGKVHLWTGRSPELLGAPQHLLNEVVVDQLAG